MFNSTTSFAQNNFMGFLSRFSIPIDLGISGTIFNAKPSVFGDFLLSSGMVGTGVGFEITPDDPDTTWIKPFLRFQVGIGLPYQSAQVTSKLLIENKIYFILGGEFVHQARCAGWLRQECIRTDREVTTTWRCTRNNCQCVPPSQDADDQEMLAGGWVIDSRRRGKWVTGSYVPPCEEVYEQALEPCPEFKIPPPPPPIPNGMQVFMKTGFVFDTMPSRIKSFNSQLKE